MIYAFDLDGTLVSLTHKTGGYSHAFPFYDRIAKVNKLYDEGHEIIIYTARGCVSGLTEQLEILTHNQLKAFGIKHHKLVMGQKIHYDLLIDDKAITADTYFGTVFRQGIIAGNFDVMHPGYIQMFEDAAARCDSLLVALHADPSLERPDKLKPILSIDDRHSMLLSLKAVSSVIIYKKEEDLLGILKQYPRHIRILGSDYKDKEFTGSELEGNTVYYHERTTGWSTTDFKKKIAASIKTP